ncbi:MAG: pseudouridine synthase [Myxococcota bacterium]
MSEVRLQQIIARAGVASRRRAEGLIAEGRVTVNGEVVTKLGTRARPGEDVITVDGQPIGPAQELATVIMHKPVQVVTTLDDPRSRETVADLVKDEPYRFVPVGRLDYQTEGLLFLTTDGELVNRLLHPRHHVPKTYQVKVKGRPRPHALDGLRDGLELDDGRTRPALVEVLESGDRSTWLEIVVTEGRNRLVRRMVDAVGHPALRVVRTEMATVELGDLRPGQFRYLSPDEVAAIYATAGLPPPKASARAREIGTALLGTSRRGRGPRPGASVGPSSWASETPVRTEARAPRSGPRTERREEASGRSTGRGRPRRSSGRVGRGSGRVGRGSGSPRGAGPGRGASRGRGRSPGTSPRGRGPRGRPQGR